MTTNTMASLSTAGRLRVVRDPVETARDGIE